MVELKVIVTGTGRCGTVFMANLLTSLGWPCGHEAIFGPDGLEHARRVLSGVSGPENSPISRLGEVLSEDMDIVGDSSYMAAPFLREFETTVVHVVRNPFPVVASLMGGVFRNFTAARPTDFEDIPDHINYETFIYENLPDMGRDMPQLDRACLFYIRWNEMIESSGKVDLLHRIEDSPDRIRKMFGGPADFYSASGCNSFADSSKKWTMLQVETKSIRRDLKDIMKRYGYKIPPSFA